mmetsp:Transcript_7633/g.18659  ORF Transcript_7633/g.18659 Transcript_7633/m.18659 type:complete len:119 (+) Transcript_7633:511-867(+)
MMLTAEGPWSSDWQPDTPSGKAPVWAAFIHPDITMSTTHTHTLHGMAATAFIPFRLHFSRWALSVCLSVYRFLRVCPSLAGCCDPLSSSGVWHVLCLFFLYVMGPSSPAWLMKGLFTD